MDFNNKVILITGASTGIGKAIAEKLMNMNCNLVLTARRPELIEEYVDRAQNKINVPLILKNDVSKKEETTEAYKKIIEKFGRVDTAILNAGVGFHVKVEEYNSVFAEQTFGTNLLGVVYWVEQLLPEFIKRKEGIIAGISSLADNRGYGGFYSSSKAALSNYLEGLSVELKNHGVKVITLRPGFVDTPINSKNNYKMQFMMNAEKAAEIILKGIEKEKRLIQFPWQMVFITQLIGAMPGSFYEWLASKKVK